MTNTFPESLIPNSESSHSTPDSQLPSSEVAISVRNLSKKYRLYETPQHRLREALHPFRKKYHHDFWALKDVSFEVKKGECIGIIGRNGSGKSTLLKLICGILQPSEGSVQVNGRISAILELGAGFNVEYTGAENIYANGTIMGFSKKDMDARYQSIVDFANIGEFIDQPVKTYSSGMFVRLAFACAVNVDPDILIVDEALAVGDVEFRSKCYLKFAELAKKCAVIYVTHELQHVSKMCDNVLVLNQGSKYFYGPPLQGIDEYNNLCGEQKTISAGSGEAKITNLKLLNEANEEAYIFQYNSPLQIEFDVEVMEKYEEYAVSLTIMDQGGGLIVQCHSMYNKIVLKNDAIKHTLNVRINQLQLNPAKYFLSIVVYDKSNTRILVWLYAVKNFAVVGDFYGSASIQFMGEWNIEAVS